MWSVMLLAVPLLIINICIKEPKDQGSSSPQDPEASVPLKSKDHGQPDGIELAEQME